MPDLKAQWMDREAVACCFQDIPGQEVEWPRPVVDRHRLQYWLPAALLFGFTNPGEGVEDEV